MLKMTLLLMDYVPYIFSPVQLIHETGSVSLLRRIYTSILFLNSFLAVGFPLSVVSSGRLLDLFCWC